MIFNIDAAWSFGRAVIAEDVVAFQAAFRPGDKSVCAWVAENRPGVVRVQFDLEARADVYQDAVDRALTELWDLNRKHGLTGRPVEIVAMTQDGMARWKDGVPDLTA